MNDQDQKPTIRKRSISNQDDDKLTTYSNSQFEPHSTNTDEDINVRGEEKSGVMPSSSSNDQTTNSNKENEKFAALEKQISQLTQLVAQQAKEKQNVTEPHNRFSEYIPPEQKFVFSDSPRPDNGNNPRVVLSKEIRQKRLSESKERITFLLTFLVVISVIVFGFSAGYFDGLTRMLNGNRSVEQKFELMEMQSVFPASSCFPIIHEEDSEDQKSTDFLYSNQHRLEISLLQHLKEQQMGVISAFRVGVPHCYMIVEFEDGTYLHMYNSKIIDFSITDVSSLSEIAHNCPQLKRWLRRSNQILVRYDDKHMNTHVLSLEGKEAWMFQHEYAYNLGYDICEGQDTGIELLFELFSVTDGQSKN